MSLKKKVAELAEINGKMAKVLEQAGSDLDLSKCTDLPGTTSKERIEALGKMKKEEDALGQEVGDLQKIAADRDERKAANDAALKAGRLPHPDQDEEKKGVPKLEERIKSLGEVFTGAAKDMKCGLADLMGKTIDVPEAHTLGRMLKTDMTTAAGFAPQSIRETEIQPYAVEPPSVIDIIPSGSTSQNAVLYMEQTTRTNNAAERAENATHGEAAFAYTERTVEVENIGVSLPVTDRQLDDVPFIQGEINAELPRMIRERLSFQIINGDGTSPNLEGMEDRASIQTQAYSNSIVETLYKAMTAVRTTGKAEVSNIILNPNDWEKVRLMVDNNGNYVWGHPSEVGPERIWGKPVVNTTDQTEGLSCLGDFARHCKLYERAGMTMKMTDAHASEFLVGVIWIKVNIRVAMAWKRPTAFVLATLA